MALNGPQVAPLNDKATARTATGKATTVELELLFGVADKYFQKRVFYKFLPNVVASGTVRWH